MSSSEIPEGTVTVLFTDLVDSTRLNQQLGDEEARHIGRTIEAMARGSVENHRGVLIKEMGDGLMAAFASARRAISASREMQGEMRRLRRAGLDESVQMRIGLHTGEVIAEDGDIHGETVIIAKRIEGLAPPGGILASDTVHGVLGTARDELIDHGRAELKGIDSEWQLYLVPLLEDEGDTGLSDQEATPYVGRLAEREQLRGLLEATAGGQGGIVLVSGRAGTGKTRMTREAAEMASRLGMTVLTGNCVDMASPPPYQPTVDHLEQAARNTTPEQLRAVLGENAPEVAMLMPSLRQRYDDIPPPPELTPEQERRYMLHGVAEFIERAAANLPLVLVFEDLHWADESTLLLLRHIGPRSTQVPVLVIGTYRQDELGPDRPLTSALGPLLRDAHAVELKLDLLSREEVTAILSSRAGQQPPPELVDLVMHETQGNPFFVEEIYRHLRDAGKLFDAEGRWRSGFEIGETEVPRGVRLVIGRRLDQLDPEHRKVLSTAAVIGRTFSFDHLAACARVDDDAIFDALEAAERLSLVEEAASDRDAVYVFLHEQFRQALLGELSLPRRQRVHLNVADAMVGRDRDGAAVEIAHHLHQAGPAAPSQRTAAALIEAAEVTLASLAFEDALRHLDRAEPLVEGDQRIALRSAQARALRGSGRVDDALSVLEAELQVDGDGLDRNALRLQRVQLLNDQYRAVETLDDLALLVALADRDEVPDLELDIRLARGRTHYILSTDDQTHAEPARAAYEEAYEAAKRRGDKRKMALALLPTTWFTDYWHDYRDTAAANVGEALQLAEELGDADLQLDARVAMMHRIGLSAGADASEDLLAELEARRDPVRLNAHCFWMMWQRLASAQLADAVAMCDKGMDLAELIGVAPVQYGSIKAIVLAHMGRYDEVDAAIAREVTDDEHPFGQAMASLARSCYLEVIGAWGPAAESYLDTFDRAQALSRTWMQAWASSSLAVVQAHLGEDTDIDHEALSDRAQIFGGWTGSITGAAIALAQGRHDLVLPAVEELLGAGVPISRERLRALDLAAQAQLGLGEFAEARELADVGVAAVEETGAESVGWRFLRVRQLALEALGQQAEADDAGREAARRFDILAARIGEPDLREWFERQPLAPRA